MNESKNTINEVEDKKTKSIKRERLKNSLIKYMSIMELVLVGLFIVLVLSLPIVLLIANKGIPNDFSDSMIAILSAGTLIYSLLHSKLNRKQKYIIGYSLLLIIFALLVIVVFAIAILMQKYVGDIASYVSLGCLVISGFVECSKVIIDSRTIEMQKEKERDERVDKLEKNGLFTSEK